jgi:aromatic-L-amino-acid decarboxylase
MADSSLFPSRTDRAKSNEVLNRALDTVQDRISAGSVRPTTTLDDFHVSLATYDFQTPVSMAKVAAWIIDELTTGLVQVSHPRYFGLFNPAPTYPAQVADRIVSVFNPQLATATTSPIAVETEAHVIRAINARIGFPASAGGNFTTGGAESNYTALIVALTQANVDFAQLGVRAFSGSPTFYLSKDCHLAWIKIAHMTGIGRDAARLVDTDGMGRMSPDALRAMIQADVAQGHVPVMVVATAGTTNAGMVDPLEACAMIAKEHHLWFHIDAAWGGAAIASNTARKALDGLDRADSVTIDGHKWFATTMGCGMFLIRKPAMLNQTFHVSTSYMPSDNSIDPYTNTVQWSRRFIGLRLFLSLAVGGWQGYSDHVEHSLLLIEILQLMLEKRGWTMLNQSPLGVICLIPPEGSRDVSHIVEDVIASGDAWVSVAMFEGRKIVRACVTSGDSTADDISILVEALTHAASRDQEKKEIQP